MALELQFVTGNKNKVTEAQDLLSEFEITQIDIDLPEIKSENIEEIAEYSLKAVPSSIERPVFVEDSGVFIGSLGGFPGPISGYVNQKLGNERVLSLLAEQEDRSAHFESVIALEIPEGDVITFRGIVEGQIAEEERGEGGFDYDSIFVPTGENRTLAEMETIEKNEYSHRGHALESIRKYLLGR